MRSRGGALALALLAVSGCSLEGGAGSSASPGGAAPAGPPLEAAWYQDSDGNAVPDFVEVEEGFDPRGDDCVPDRCQSRGTPSAETLLEKGQNTMLVLDSSGSMAGPAGADQTKLEAAKEAVERYAKLAPPSLDRLGFAVYGHRGGRTEARKAESCRGSEVLAPVGEFGRGSATRTLARFEPTGFTPVAGALEVAGEAFAGREDELNRVVLISDGLETCGGDPVAMARRLRTSGVRVAVDVVGFDIDRSADVDRLKAVADAGGGQYTDAQTGADLKGYFSGLIDQRKTLSQELLCFGRETAQEAAPCRGRFIRETSLAMAQKERDVQREDPRRADAIRAVIDRAETAFDREFETAGARRDERLAEVQAQIDQIEELEADLERRR